jgi:hypothetical protein
MEPQRQEFQSPPRSREEDIPVYSSPTLYGPPQPLPAATQCGPASYGQGSGFATASQGEPANYAQGLASAAATSWGASQTAPQVNNRGYPTWQHRHEYGGQQHGFQVPAGMATAGGYQYYPPGAPWMADGPAGAAPFAGAPMVGPNGPPPAYWGPPAQSSAAGSMAKIFQPLKMTAFRGSEGEQGVKAMRLVQSMDVNKDSTPNLTENQICMTMWANLTDSARDWVHTENEAYKKLHGGAPLLSNWTALRQKFIDRYGLVNPAESLERLSQLRQGSDEAVANVAQQARDLFIEAHVKHDKIKIHKYMMSLRSPLREQLYTARPKTFEEAVEVAVALEDGLWALEDF